MKKQLTLLFFLMAFCLNAFTQTKTYFFENESKFIGGQFDAVSNNGRFVVGRNATSTVVYLLDTKTGKLQEIKDYSHIEANDVTDNGVLAGKFQDPNAIRYKKADDGTITEEVCIVPGIYKDGKWIAVERAEVLNGGGYDGRINSISGDGKLMGGYIPTTYWGKDENGDPILMASMTKYEPVIWDEDGKIIQRLPYGDSSQGASIISMSDDGKTACGWYDGSMYGDIIIWKDGERVDTQNYGGSGNAVSANGQFVVGGCGKDMARSYSKPFIWSEEKGLVISEDVPAETRYSQMYGITNDGKMAVGSIDLDQMTVKRYPVILVDGVHYNFDTWMNDNYELKGPYGASFWAAKSISADGNVICGIGYYSQARAPWVVVFDESKIPEIPIVGIDNVTKELDVKATFDAASGMLNIEGEYTSVNLYNTVGACVLTDNSAESTIHISNLNEGIYFAKIMKGQAARTFKVAITR